MQTPAIATRTVGHAEELMDAFMEIVSDGIITPIEISATNKLIRQVYSSAMETDLAQAAGIAVMRTGTDGKRAKALTNELMAG